MLRRLVAPAVAAATVALVAGCATPPVADPSVVPVMPVAMTLTTEHPVTVLDDGDGAELCLGMVLTSLPPQCGGPKLVDWDWSQHSGEYTEQSGVRWGEFIVAGFYDADAGTFTPTQVVSGEGYQWPTHDPVDFSSPCAAPAGGWQVLDDAKTTRESMDAGLRRAEQLPGYAGAWVDQSPNRSNDEMAMNDPTLTILNIRVSDDIPAAEAALREVWGGMLCVSAAERTQAELSAIQAALPTEHTLMAGIDTMRGTVELQVIYDDGTLQAEMDAAHGPGTVRVSSALVPAA